MFARIVQQKPSEFTLAACSCRMAAPRGLEGRREALGVIANRGPPQDRLPRPPPGRLSARFNVVAIVTRSNPSPTPHSGPANDRTRDAA